MIGYRIAVVVLLALITACMTCSSLFPLFRLTTYNPLNGNRLRFTYYYWYMEAAVIPPDNVWSTARQYTRDDPCAALRRHYVASSVLSVIATAAGALATILGAAWVPTGRCVALGVAVFVLTCVAFVCSTVVLGLMAHAYRGDICTSDYATTFSLSEAGFGQVEGFILLGVAMAGYTGLTVALVAGFLCGLHTEQHHRAKDESQMTSRQSLKTSPDSGGDAAKSHFNAADFAHKD